MDLESLKTQKWSLDLQSKLDERKNNFLTRIRKIRQGPQKSHVQFSEQSYLSFCSNDYLGLANHPDIKKAFQRGVDRYGVGSSASQIISGYTNAHFALEEELAEFLNVEKTVIFSTGYMANIGVLTTLFGRFDEIYHDKLNHASLIDGVRLSQAKSFRYPHLDVISLQRRLQRQDSSTKTPVQKLIVTEGMFSMGGELAPLNNLVEISKYHQTGLMIDDAHGIGVLGEQGRGTLEYLKVHAKDIHILTGTFGKAFGCFGAFAAGGQTVIESLIQFSRPFIYTTALPAALIEAIRTSLRIIQRENHRRIQLQFLIQKFKKQTYQLGLKFIPSDTPIQSLIIGETALTFFIGKALESRGIMVGVIRVPSVPTGTCRLRICLTAVHTESELDYLLDTLEWVQKFIPKP